jgi:CheY-like chemotaxis protein
MIKTQMSVAVIDDDQDDLDIMEQVIKALDTQMSCCRLYMYPQAAVDDLLRASEEQRPGFIFIDINMPGLSGDKCLQILRGNAAFDDVRIIMYSTSMPEKTAQQLRAAGANYVFEKPVRIKDYTNILGAILLPA